MFRVINYKDGKGYIVYAVNKEKEGFTSFLIYDEVYGWCWEDAMKYTPTN